MKSLFAKKLICIHCNGYFKRKIERGKIKYCCTNYNMGRCDRRIMLEEEFLISCLERRFQRKLSHEEIKDLVKLVKVEDKLLFEIEINGQESIVYGKNFVRY